MNCDDVDGFVCIGLPVQAKYDSQTKLLLRSNPVSGLTLPIHLKDLSLNLKIGATSPAKHTQKGITKQRCHFH